MVDERVTVKPKFADPHVFVSVAFLEQGFKMARSGCPVAGCGKPITSQSLRVDASCVKATFVCARGHPLTWTSSEQVGRQMLVLNKLVPAAAVMSGLKVVPMKRFLGLLSVDSQNADYMKKGSLDLLAELTKELWNEEMMRTREEMLKEPIFDAGVHSDRFNSLFLCLLLLSYYTNVILFF